MSDFRRLPSYGFTLIEILVAFFIATTALGLLYSIHANSTSTVLLAEEYEQATDLAQSLIAELAASETTLAFTRSGVTAEKYRWTVRSGAYQSGADVAARDMEPFHIRDLAVEVAWVSRDKERHITLFTAKPFFEPTR